MELRAMRASRASRASEKEEEEAEWHRGGSDESSWRPKFFSPSLGASKA